jgi:hypothetical protein
LPPFSFHKTGHVISIKALQNCQSKIKTCQKAPMIISGAWLIAPVGEGLRWERGP